MVIIKICYGDVWICGLKEDEVTKIDMGILRWFGHMEQVNDRNI